MATADPNLDGRDGGKPTTRHGNHTGAATEKEHEKGSGQNEPAVVDPANLVQS